MRDVLKFQIVLIQFEKKNQNFGLMHIVLLPQCEDLIRVKNHVKKNVFTCLKKCSTNLIL